MNQSGCIIRKMLFLVLGSFFLIMLTTSSGFAENERQGTVVETLDAANYTYLNIQTSTQKLWVAIPASVVEVGEVVTYLQGMVMNDFHSKSLNKTFDSIIFSPGLEGKDKKVDKTVSTPQQSSASFADAVANENNNPTSSQSRTGETSGSAGAMVPFLEAEVEKASGENSYTVGEIFDNALNLNGKKIRIRGKVVKVSPNIMGKNWIHIQDGTGDPMKNSHDLVVTSNELAEVNDVVLIEGTMAANKDFGFGYQYVAIIEQADLIKE